MYKDARTYKSQITTVFTQETKTGPYHQSSEPRHCLKQYLLSFTLIPFFTPHLALQDGFLSSGFSSHVSWCNHYFIESKVVTKTLLKEGQKRRWGKWRKQLLDDRKEKWRYCNFKDEELDRCLWRTRFGRGYVPVERQAKLRMTESCQRASLHTTP